MKSKYCSRCCESISSSTKSGLCRKCAQKKASEKRRKIYLDRYGVDNPSKLPEIKQKIKDTFTEKYGEGVTCAMHVKEFRDKVTETTQERYGVPWYIESDEYLKNSHFRISNKNKEVGQYLQELGFTVEYEHTLGPKQYDLYVKEKNLLIEIDPTYTHSVQGNHWNKEGLDPMYHFDKTQFARENGYECIHIFDWDDWKSILYSLLVKKHTYLTQETNHIFDNSKFLTSDIPIGYRIIQYHEPKCWLSKDEKSMPWWRGLDSKSFYETGWLPIFDCGLVEITCDPLRKFKSFDAKAIKFDDWMSYNEYKQIKRKESQIKYCEFCFQPFVPNSPHQRYCKRIHTRKCPVCREEYIEDNVENLKRPPVACSYECRKILRRKTSLERYGVTAPGNSPQARQKAQETMRMRYGVNYAMMNEELRAKQKQTCMNRYGVDNVAKVPEILERRTQSLLNTNRAKKVEEMKEIDREV